MDDGKDIMTDLEELRKEFEEECEAEGYPSHGSNYELRVATLMESEYYAKLLNRW